MRRPVAVRRQAQRQADRQGDSGRRGQPHARWSTSLLEEQLGQPVHAEVDPDLCVAMGAAIQGGLIAGIDVGPVLVDITPHTLGIQASATSTGGCPTTASSR